METHNHLEPRLVIEKENGVRRAKVLEMESADRQQCTEVNEKEGVRGDVRKSSSTPRRPPPPHQTSEIALRNSGSPMRTIVLSAGEEGHASAPSPGGSGRGRPTPKSAPSGGPSGLDLRLGGVFA